MLFEVGIDKYTNYVTITKSPGTLKYFKGKSKTLRDYLGDYQCEDICMDVVIEFIAQLKERNGNVSNSTLNKYVEELNKVLKYNGYEKIPFKKLRELQKEIQVIPQDTIDKLFSHFGRDFSNKWNYRNYIYLSVLLETGVRFSEAQSIEVKYIDFESCTILLKKTKTKVERVVFITPKTRDLIENFITTHSINGYLFTDFEGNQLEYVAIRAILERARKRLEIPKEISISPHTWRHTFATNYLKRGGNIEVLRKIMGHTSIEVTKKYLHVDRSFMNKDFMLTMGY